MGCGSSVPVRKKKMPHMSVRAADRNTEIEKRLNQVRKAEKKTVKILLVGTGESGKSTVLKQMRLIHGQGFTEFERIQYTKVIWSDCIKSMKIVLRNARKMGIPLTDEGLLLECKKIALAAPDGFDDEAADAQVLLKDYDMRTHSQLHDDALKAARLAALAKEDLDVDFDDPLSAMEEKELQKRQHPNKRQVAEAIWQLWKHEPAVQQVMSRSNEFQLEVNAQYYFENVRSYCDPNYKANDQDILVGRIKTTGITETRFDMGESICRMVDVGGQRSERKKWIHCFDDVTALLFVAAVSEYDEVLYEDRAVNRMVESLHLFEQIINSRWFAQTPIILFLNKTDILEQKLTRKNFNKYFPRYTGDPTSSMAVCGYLRKVFQTTNRVPSRPVYVHRTCATDTTSMKFVMSAVTDVVFQKNLEHSGVI